MTDERRLPAGHTAAFLAEATSLRRLPRAPGRLRPPGYAKRFEGRALVYDAFWHDDGARILLVGPPPLNLLPHYGEVRYRALPSGVVLSALHHRSVSVMVTALHGAPAGTEAVEMAFAGELHVLPVQPNASPALAGRHVLFTMNKDNELGWIAEWARYHARMQGADAVVLFDNGSTRYAVPELEATLLAVPGIARVAVLSWPYRYGAPDLAIRVNPHYTLFPQVASMSVALRRYGARADGLLNCDIDELAATPPGPTIFELARRSRHGLVVMQGQFVEALRAPEADAAAITHRSFVSRLRDPKARLSGLRKWALDPARPWVRELAVLPYMHWIEGRPLFGKTRLPGVFYWHFRGINTNWKEIRTDASHLSPGDVEIDQRLAAAFALEQDQENHVRD